MKFHKAKCKVLHLGRDNAQYQHRMGNGWVGSSPSEKDLGTPVGDKFNMSWQCARAAQNTKHILGCITSSVASRLREVILLLCSQRPHLESCIQL